jgi:PEGA domain
MRRSTLAAFFSLALLSSAVFAEPTAADRATARTLAQEGQQALESKNYSAAIDKFGRADSLVHAPTLLLGLARAQVGLGRLVEAQESYNRIIREGVPAGSPRSWTKALDDANKEVAALPARLPWVTITVLGPTSPEVIIDSTPVPIASLGVKRPVNPGSHTIKVSAEGYVPTEKAITLSDGQSLTVNLELEQTPADASQVANKTSKGADAASSAGSSDTRKIIAISALGLGGAGIIVGAVTGLLAMKKHSELEKAGCSGSFCDASQASALDTFHTYGTISTVGFIVGGAGVIAGTILLVTQPRESTPPTGARISPFIALGGAGVKGTFW